jgi:hypothetical protein
VAWLRLTFPLFTNDDIAKVLLYYPSSNASTNPNAPLYATSGDSGPSALNQSSVGTGQQERADNIYAETTFVCPSYWMAEAYSDRGRTSFKYQFSVPPALHGSDVSGCKPQSRPFSPESSQLTRMLQRLRSSGTEYRARPSTRLPTDLGQFHNGEQPEHLLQCCEWCVIRECRCVERCKQLATIHNLCSIPDQSE